MCSLVSVCLFDSASQPLSQPTQGQDRPASSASSSTPIIRRQVDGGALSDETTRSLTPVLPNLNLSEVKEDEDEDTIKLDDLRTTTVEELDDSLTDSVLVEAAMKERQQSTRLERRVESPKRVLCNINRADPNLEKIKKNLNSAEGVKVGVVNPMSPMAKFSFVVVLSQVPRDYLKMVDQLCKRENGLKVNSISSRCTHVVTGLDTDAQGIRNCPRTLKVIQGR